MDAQTEHFRQQKKVSQELATRFKNNRVLCVPMNTTNSNYGWLSRKPRSHTLSRGRVGGINPGWALARKLENSILALIIFAPDATVWTRRLRRVGARSPLTNSLSRLKGADAGVYTDERAIVVDQFVSRLKGAGARVKGASTRRQWLATDLPLGQGKDQSFWTSDTSLSKARIALRSQLAANPQHETLVTHAVSAPTPSLPPKKRPIPKAASRTFIQAAKEQEVIAISSDSELEPEIAGKDEDVEEDPEEGPEEAPQDAGMKEEEEDPEEDPEEENAAEEGVRKEDDFADY
ncbi:hypothetical protein PIB30_068292 [Stylosanthes scabra]|uniref:Uncharacterized protein n=1 Tax=Stylosanthes scabra TaxID=79078 RepID=A0ABU6UM92_9FABA|nr:hypothetical protein [Stylosanthes scabra]